MTKILLITLLVASLGACGERSATDARDDGPFLAQEGGGDFETDADADTYAGPAPLTVRFSAQSIDASGRVRHEWAFDDRITSDEQNPVHTFRRPGWYAVTLDTRDAAGRTYRSNLMLHAWRPKDWARTQRGQDLRIVKRNIRELQRKNAELAAAATRLARNGTAAETTSPPQ